MGRCIVTTRVADHNRQVDHREMAQLSTPDFDFGDEDLPTDTVVTSANGGVTMTSKTVDADDGIDTSAVCDRSRFDGLMAEEANALSEAPCGVYRLKICPDRPGASTCVITSTA